MHILLMAEHYWPEDISGAVLATQLAESLIDLGHNVTFATCLPSYPHGIVFDGYRGKLFRRETHNKVRVIRTWNHTASRGDIKGRFIAYATLSATALVSGLVAKRPDIIMSYSPPMPLGLTALIISKLRRVPWVLRVEDLFPEYAIKTGVIRNRAAIRILNWLEKLFYRHAVHVSVISESLRQKLLERGVPPEKISLFPVWADPDEVIPMSKDTTFRRENGWQDKFIVLYTGNLGLTCALEGAIEAAEILKTHSDIQFVIVGEGIKKTELVATAKQRGLTNVVFWPYQPRDKFPELLATADAALVTINEDSYATSLPSKTFNYLASGRPILTMAPLHSELSHIVRDADAGVCIPPDRPQELAEAILELRATPAAREVKGANGRRLLETQFSREHCVNLYATMFQQYAKKR